MASDAMVMPSWQAERYSSMRSICLRASAAPRWPSSASCSILERRDAHERELGGDEEPVKEHEEEDREEQ